MPAKKRAPHNFYMASDRARVSQYIPVLPRVIFYKASPNAQCILQCKGRLNAAKPYTSNPSSFETTAGLKYAESGRRLSTWANSVHTSSQESNKSERTIRSPSLLDSVPPFRTAIDGHLKPLVIKPQAWVNIWQRACLSTSRLRSALTYERARRQSTKCPPSSAISSTNQALLENVNVGLWLGMKHAVGKGSRVEGPPK